MQHLIRRSLATAVVSFSPRAPHSPPKNSPPIYTQHTTSKRELTHITHDGRTSLRKHVFGKGNIFSRWWSKMTVDTYPVLGAIFGGVALALWFGTRGLMYNPDVKINKVQRAQTIRDNLEEGKAWIKHHKSFRGDGFFGNTAKE